MNKQPQPIERPRLQRLMQDALANPLVVLSAGAGHGKTSAVSGYLATVAERVLWLNLTPLENFPPRFWQCLTEAVAPWDAAFAGWLQKLAFPESLPALHEFLQHLGTFAQKGERLILVLDNQHCLTPGPVLDLIQNIVWASLDNLAVVLISERQVQINAGDGKQGFYLDDKQLRFTPDEVRLYFQVAGLQLSQAQLEQIMTISEGWAFAVYTLAAALRERGSLDEYQLDGALSELFALLDASLYEPLEEQAKQALVLLSLLEEFTPELARELTGLSLARLQELLRGLSQVRYRAEPPRYYFSQLFQRFLRQKQAFVEPELRRDFLNRAADWYLARAQYAEAVDCYLAAGNYDGVYALFRQINYGRATMRWAGWGLAVLERLPADYLNAHPLLLVIQASMLMRVNRNQETDRLLAQVEAQLAPRLAEPEPRAVFGEALALRAILHMRLGLLDFPQLLRQADACLPQGSSFFPKQPVNLGNGNTLVFPQPRAGCLAEIEQALLESAPFADRVLHGLGAGREFLACAEASFYRGEFKSAISQIHQAIYKASAHEQWDLVTNCYYLLTRVNMAQGDLDLLEDSLHKLHQYAALVPEDEYYALPEIAEGAFLLMTGQSAQTAAWIRDDSLPLANWHFTTGRELVLKALYLLGQGAYQGVLDVAALGRRLCADNGQGFSGLKLLILQALAHGKLRDFEAAAEALLEALALTRDNQLLLPFVEFGGEMRNLISLLRKYQPLRLGDDAWLALIARKAATYAKYQSIVTRQYREKHAIQPSLLDSLTPREKTILKSLCQGLTNEEIAAKLEVRPSTIKSALGRIYPKLEAANRADAVRIAMAEDILRH